MQLARSDVVSETCKNRLPRSTDLSLVTGGAWRSSSDTTAYQLPSNVERTRDEKKKVKASRCSPVFERRRNSVSCTPHTEAKS